MAEIPVLKQLFLHVRKFFSVGIIRHWNEFPSKKLNVLSKDVFRLDKYWLSKIGVVLSGERKS